MKANKIFIVLKFDDCPILLDYPNNVPLPRIGETILLQNKETSGKCYDGIVYDIRHNISDTMTEVKIKAK